jgi:nicotinamide mononucleotide (NMN) deamidase PncC
VAGPAGVGAEQRRFPGDRETVRTRAVMTALDLVRRALLAL